MPRWTQVQFLLRFPGPPCQEDWAVDGGCRGSGTEPEPEWNQQYSPVLVSKLQPKFSSCSIPTLSIWVSTRFRLQLSWNTEITAALTTASATWPLTFADNPHPHLFCTSLVVFPLLWTVDPRFLNPSFTSSPGFPSPAPYHYHRWQSSTNTPRPSTYLLLQQLFTTVLRATPCFAPPSHTFLPLLTFWFSTTVPRHGDLLLT